MLIHLVDVSGASGRDPVEDFDTIRTRARALQPGAARRSRSSSPPTRSTRSTIRSASTRSRSARRSSKLPFFPISAVTGEGMQELIEAAWPIIAKARASRGAERRRSEADAGRSREARSTRGSARRRAEHARRHRRAARPRIDDARRPRRHVRSHSPRPPRGGARAQQRSASTRPARPVAHPAASRRPAPRPAIIGSRWRRWPPPSVPGWSASRRRARARRTVVHVRHAADAVAARDGHAAGRRFSSSSAPMRSQKLPPGRRYPAVLDLAHFVVVVAPRNHVRLVARPRCPAAVPLRMTTPAAGGVTAIANARDLLVEAAHSRRLVDRDSAARSRRRASSAAWCPTSVARYIAQHRLYARDRRAAAAGQSCMAKTAAKAKTTHARPDADRRAKAAKKRDRRDPRSCRRRSSVAHRGGAGQQGDRRGGARPEEGGRVHGLLRDLLGREPAAGAGHCRCGGRSSQGAEAASVAGGRLRARRVDPARLLRLRHPRLLAARPRRSTASIASGAAPSASNSPTTTDAVARRRPVTALRRPPSIAALTHSLFAAAVRGLRRRRSHRPLDGAVCDACWAHRTVAAARAAPAANRSPWRQRRDVVSAMPRRSPRARSRSAVGPYEGRLRDIIHALKYDGRRSIAPRRSAR